MRRSTSDSQSSPVARRNQNIRGVMDSLRRIVRELRLSARDAQRAAGISGAQLFVLQTLAEEPAASLNDLADRTLTDQSSVSVVVKRLSERKLVARKASRTDGRRIELSLTAAGRRLLARCPEPTQARLVTALRRVAPGELTELMAGLTSLVRHMGIEDSAARMFFDEELAPQEGRRSGVALVAPEREAAPRRRNSRPDP